MNLIRLSFVLLLFPNFASAKTKIFCTNQETSLSVEIKEDQSALIQLGQSEKERLSFQSAALSSDHNRNYSFYVGTIQEDETKGQLEIVRGVENELITLQFVIVNPNGMDEYFNYEVDQCE